MLLDIYTSFCQQNEAVSEEPTTEQDCRPTAALEVHQPTEISVKGNYEHGEEDASKNQPTVDDLKAPLLAAVGAADLALERVNEIVATLRERAGEARTDAETRVEESRARLTKLQEDLPTQFGELRDRLTSDELRKFAESYADAAQTTYNNLVERGEAALERLRTPARARGGSRARGAY